VKFTLTKDYSATDIGHFRAFVDLHLKEVKHEILAIWFGSTDKSARFRDDTDKLDGYGSQSGIGAGIAGGQWEKQIRLNETTPDEEAENSLNSWVPVGWSNGCGQETVRTIVIKYSHDSGLVRIRPRLALRDLDGCFFLPVVNRSLAEKVQSIQVFANGYELAS